MNTYYAKIIRTEEIWIPVDADSKEDAREIMESTKGVVVVLEVRENKPEEE